MPEFMRPTVDQFNAWIVETTHGSEIIPADLVPSGETLALDDAREYCEGEPRESDDAPGTADAEYVRGRYFARLSAPGYMDSTEWDGPHHSADSAMRSLVEMHEEFAPSRMVCIDCQTVIEGCDLSGFDYRYSPSEAASRIAECQAGVAFAGGNLVACGEWSDEEFSRAPCDCCASRLHGARFGYRAI